MSPAQTMCHLPLSRISWCLNCRKASWLPEMSELYLALQHQLLLGMQYRHPGGVKQEHEWHRSGTVELTWLLHWS